MRESARMLGREAMAWARQGALMIRGRRPRRYVPGEAARVVVFVHGFGAAGPVFEPMRAHVEERLGVSTLDFTYGSLTSFHRVAEGLAAHVERHVDPGARLDLVGHSLGGLLARWYVQELGGAARVSRLVTLATPHAGTRSARLAPGPLRAALVPESPIVRRLHLGRHRAEGVSHTALVAGADLMVTPPASAAALPDAEVRWFETIGHNGMLFEPDVLEAVVDALAE
ncbi:MAG: alpha/beta fold hydrolase [Sandaracinaceae bacterium]|nr:alpha/beta fold hydrolase [Sandaracinaceae bacterium]